MVRLDRSGVVEPDEWKGKVEKSLPDPKLFWQTAKAFETLKLNGSTRRNGFKVYAAHVLPAPTHEFPPVWRKVKSVKVALAAMSGGNCAYCQACVEDNSYGPIEHFKPKSIFPTLTYALDNYFFGCERCNLSKSGKWPAQGTYVRPDEGDPSTRFSFDEHGRVKAAPMDPNARATIRDLKLNRKGLRKHRRVAIGQRLTALRPILSMPDLTDAQRDELVRPYIVEPLSRFSEAINQNVRRAVRASFPQMPL